MPTIHLGVYLTSGKETYQAVRWALEVSRYTSLVEHSMDDACTRVDSAQMYRNERESGKAISDFLQSEANTDSLTREHVHFTSKLASNSAYETARKAISRSVKEAGLGYIDLFLLHSPYGGKQARLDSWRAVEDAINDGQVKTGGVSNYGVKHVHPFNTRKDITSFCQQHNIVVEAYAPLVRALRMKHPKIVALSKKYSCTSAQLLVRWSLQHGYVPLPKSTKKERIVENSQIGGFEIDDADMEMMDGLDEYLVTDWDPTDCD
ncbi:hypothetical protein CFE70_007262 [Pyrenophora teres f. teres 0-1]